MIEVAPDSCRVSDRCTLCFLAIGLAVAQTPSRFACFGEGDNMLLLSTGDAQDRCRVPAARILMKLSLADGNGLHFQLRRVDSDLHTISVLI